MTADQRRQTCMIIKVQLWTCFYSLVNNPWHFRNIVKDKQGTCPRDLTAYRGQVMGRCFRGRRLVMKKRGYTARRARKIHLPPHMSMFKLRTHIMAGLPNKQHVLSEWQNSLGWLVWNDVVMPSCSNWTKFSRNFVSMHLSQWLFPLCTNTDALHFGAGKGTLKEFTLEIKVCGEKTVPRKNSDKTGKRNLLDNSWLMTNMKSSPESAWLRKIDW